MSFTINYTTETTNLIVECEVIQLEGCPNTASHLGRLLTRCQGILFRQSACKILEMTQLAVSWDSWCFAPHSGKRETLTASLMQIFFSSSSFCASLSWMSFSFFFSSAIFSFFCSSLTSESAEPGISTQKQKSYHVLSLLTETINSDNELLDSLPAEMRLPLLAIISLSLLSMLDSLLVRWVQISVRSMAMSPELLVVVMFNWKEKKRLIGWNREWRRIVSISF